MSDAGVLSLIHAVVTAATQDELFRQMQEAARILRFEKVLFGIQLQLPQTKPVQHITSGYPKDYQDLYLKKEFVLRDPTVYHALTSEKPLTWSEGMYTQASHDIMEESRKHGLAHGMSLPVHEGSTIRSMLSLARDKPFDSPAEKRYVEEGGIVLSHCVHQATKRIIVPELIAGLRPKLTARELECLKWVAQGKSNGVIADILNISDHAVDFHMRNVLSKLKVTSRQQAMVVGVSLGLIT
ncbi:MAG TPA: LuxR family transcriptional regulator [Ramlibacter sp.]|nr:LuxR family transcriptional regulator [Ramlibacter sp.]